MVTVSAEFRAFYLEVTYMCKVVIESPEENWFSGATFFEKGGAPRAVGHILLIGVWPCE